MLVNRPEYMDALKRHRDKSNLIKVITGVRRCGKSTLLELFQNYLRANGVNNDQIVNISLELLENKELRAGDRLYAKVKELTAGKNNYYVFVDELQLASDYEDVANGLRMQKNIDLYITGSNSKILSGKSTRKSDSDEKETRWGGRYIDIKMLPLSFKEYVGAFNDAHLSKDEMFRNYVEQSSFPETLEYVQDGIYNKQGVQDYLDAVYNSIIVKDIMKQDGVKDAALLERVITFMFANIGRETSTNGIVGKLNNDMKLLPNDKKVYAAILGNYVSALLNSYLFYSAVGENRKGREYLTSNAKYYAVDVGLRYHLLGGDWTADGGHILENIVYLELLRRGYKIKVGRVKDKEVDFVAQKPGGIKEYYQVSQTLVEKDTLKREFAPLKAIKDNHPKFILTRDWTSSNENGIQVANVLDWLLGTK
ncbi:MAG: ATP-binding protein [Rickettsiales bacterium]|jgi:predicted AAA+ superfamily ATPase|nr:ATP-binding protein [Rickettsiales bacterium]